MFIPAAAGKIDRWIDKWGKGGARNGNFLDYFLEWFTIDFFLQNSGIFDTKSRVVFGVWGQGFPFLGNFFQFAGF